MSEFSSAGLSFEPDLRRIVILLETLTRGGLAVALCEDRVLQAQLINTLRSRLSRRVHIFSLAPGNAQPLQQMRSASVDQGDVVMFVDVPEDEDDPAAREVLSQLEFERETFWETKINLLFWVTSSSQRLLLRVAPNFYSRRSLLVTFSSVQFAFSTLLVADWTLSSKHDFSAEFDTANNFATLFVDHAAVYGGRAQRGSSGRKKKNVAILFDKAETALECALAWQQGNRSISSRMQSRSIAECCIGLHSGVITSFEIELQGATSLTAITLRLAQLGEPGSILLSGATHERLSTMADHIAFFRHGERRMAPGVRPLSIYEALWPGQSPRTLRWARVLSNLPLRPHLVNRDSERELIAAAIEARRPIVITGSPGIGKTALALEAAHSAVRAHRLPGGVAWVELRRDYNRESVQSTLASVFKLALPHRLEISAFDLNTNAQDSLRAWENRLRAYWQSAPSLVILDGADEMMNSTSVHSLWTWVAEWASEVALIITTRPTTSLPKLSDIEQLHLEPLSERDSRTFLIASAKRNLGRGWSPHEHEVALSRMSKSCQGSPLMLELAASMTIQESFETVADHLTGGESDRTKNLSRIMREGFSRLDSDLRTAIVALSLFASPFTLEAAIAVADIKSAIIDQLTKLGWLSFAKNDTPKRYEMHSLVRDFVLEEVHDLPNVNAQLRFLNYYVNWVRDLGKTRSLANLNTQEIEAEWPNFMFALKLAISQDNVLATEASANILFSALAELLDYQGRREELLELSDMVRSSSHAVQWPRLQACAFLWRGLALGELSRLEESIIAYLQSLELFQVSSDRRGVGTVLNNLGKLYARQQRWAEAISALEEDLRICREYRDRHSEGIALSNLASVYGQMENFREAEQAYLRSLSILREFGNRSEESQTLTNLGNIYSVQQREEEAARAYQQSLTIGRELNDPSIIGHTLLNLALHSMRRNDYVAAQFLAQEAIAELEQTNLLNDLQKAKELIADLDATHLSSIA